MDKSEVFEFLRGHPIFQLATIDGDKPRVRTMSLYRADDAGILFHTRTSKDVHKQLTANPNVELCFARAHPAAEVRVSGSVERVNDEGLQKDIDPENPETVAIYRLKGGQVTTWAEDKASDPKTHLTL